ncbi:MAG: TonB-dependent receptor [Sphingobacteriales bacterium]|nr:TonB-dependent receptor [Sphingobacteriales bacterium]
MKRNKHGFLTLVLVLIAFGLQAQTSGNLKGKIVDEHSLPIVGASVHLLNTSKTTLTNETGEFSLANVSNGKYIIEITAVGYATVTTETIAGPLQTIPTVVLHSMTKQLDEVIVSAQKREEVLQKLPLSVTALGSKQVEEYRLWDIKEITGIVPNLYSADPGDKRNVTSIRGIATTSYDPTVAVYVDGVNQFNLDTYIGSLFEVERIEVLRGPQGTLYGRNAMGGVINIITKQPTNLTSGFAELNIGNLGQQRYSLGIKTPLVKNKLFFGAAGLYNGFNGYYNNSFNDSKYDKQHSFGGNYYLKFLPDNKWSFVLNLKHNNNRNNGPFPLVIGADEALKNPFQLNQNAITKMVDNTFNASFSVNHTGRYFNFNSQTAYQSNYRIYKKPIDADFSPIDGITIINDYGNNWNMTKVFTQELRLTNPSASNSPLQWTVGAYFFHQKSPVKQATHFGKDAIMVGSPDINYSLINTTRATATGEAVYAQGTYNLTDKLNVIAGLRYDNEYRKQSVLGEYQKDPDPTPLFQYRSDTAASKSFSAFSPKLGINYLVSSNHTLYFTYSKGFRTGGLTPLSADPSQPALFPYKPEYSNNFEAGWKSVFFDKKLFMNVAAFYTTVTNAQVPTLVLPDAVTITRNTGRLISKGFETEINAVPFKGLTVIHNLGYTSAKFKDLKLSQNGSEADLKGNRQIYTPDITSMLVLQYIHSLNTKHGLNISIRGEWKYIGKQYFDLANMIKQSSVNLYNVRIGLTAKKVSLFFWERNLFNKKYIGYAYDFGAVHLGDPRTFGITAGVKF